MQLRLTPGLAAGVAVLALPAAAVAAPTVTVRVEGQHATLLERTAVTLGTAPAPGNGCPGDSAAAALEAGTRGNWDRQTFAQTILGETHKFANSDYWAEWIARDGGYRYGGGICNDRLAAGDELLMLVDLSPPPSSVPTVFPLAIEGLPTGAPAGSDVTVTIVEYRTTGTPGTGMRTPVAGAAVGGVITDAAGHATIHLGGPGDAVFKAIKPGDAPSAAEHVTVTAPGAPPPPARPVKPDRAAPAARLLGLRDHQVFSRRRAPRVIRVAVPDDPSTVKKVALRLTRQRGRRCWYFSDRRGRFVRSRCVRRVYFSVPVRPRVSYLLPRRLRRGRYVLDVVAIDGAGNREALARGRSRVVLFVR
jgi:hypothetical protein